MIFVPTILLLLIFFYVYKLTVNAPISIIIQTSVSFESGCKLHIRKSNIETFLSCCFFLIHKLFKKKHCLSAKLTVNRHSVLDSETSRNYYYLNIDSIYVDLVSTHKHIHTHARPYHKHVFVYIQKGYGGKKPSKGPLFSERARRRV